jgi:hypothetical protein
MFLINIILKNEKKKKNNNNNYIYEITLNIKYINVI